MPRFDRCQSLTTAASEDDISNSPMLPTNRKSRINFRMAKKLSLVAHSVLYRLKGSCLKLQFFLSSHSKISPIKIILTRRIIILGKAQIAI